MKNILPRFPLRCILAVAVLSALLMRGESAMAGEIASNFTLPHHTNNNQTVRLSDFAGKIVVLEFFYHWCSFCQEGTPVIKREIEDYYRSKHGNPAGIAVTNVYINLGLDVAETDAFIRDNRLRLVLDDLGCTVDHPTMGESQNCTTYHNFGGSGTPHIVVINLTDRSSPLEYGEIAYIHSGYTAGVTVLEMRHAIDAIADPIKPTVRVQYPTPGLRTTNAILTARGTAADAIGLYDVVYRVVNLDGTGNGLSAVTTNVFKNWTAALDLVPGANLFQVNSRDLEGNYSAISEVVFFYVAKNPFTLTINGTGRVTPNYNGKMLEVGRPYTMTAVPGAGQVFSNWSGDIVSGDLRKTFIMVSNMTVQANFIPSPFTSLKGAYNGLFAPEGAVAHESSGLFNLLLSEGGTYSGKLRVAGKTHPFTGRFFADGTATNLVKRPGGTNDLTMELTLDLTNGTERITGLVINPNEATAWTAGLAGDHAPVYTGTNNSPARGKYTLVIPGAEDDASKPGGDGYGTVVVAARGGLTFSGTLGDGTLITQSVPLSKDGAWPLYASLYSGKGLVWSRATISDALPTAPVNGALTWIKPPVPAAKFYPAGFTLATEVIGSSYQPPTTNKVLNLDQGDLSFRGGNLEAYTNLISLAANNKLTNVGSNQPPLSFSITLSSGRFSGSVTVTNGAARKVIPFKGALLQGQDSGSGFFVGTNQTGRVHLNRQVADPE